MPAAPPKTAAGGKGEAPSGAELWEALLKLLPSDFPPGA